MEDFDREDLLNPYDIFVSMKLIEAEAQAMDQFGSCITVARLAKNAEPEKVRHLLQIFISGGQAGKGDRPHICIWRWRRDG